MSPILIQCGPVERPTRLERRAASRQTAPTPRHLGVIEGERLRLASPHRETEDYGLVKALLSLTAVALFLLAFAAFTGAL